MPLADLLKKQLSRIPLHILVAFSGWAGRIIVVISTLVSIRLLMAALGSGHYAVYALLGSLQGWFLLADFGVGVSLQNYISENRARQEEYDTYVTTTAVIVLVLLFLGILLLYIFSPLLAPLLMQGFTSLDHQTMTRIFFITGIFMSLTAMGGVAYKIWYAEQKGYLSNLFPAIASLVSLVCIWAVTHIDGIDKLYWSLVASFAPLGIFPLIALIHQTSSAAGRSSKLFDINVTRLLLKRGGKFWFFSLMAAGVLQIDYILLSQFIDARNIVVYNLSTKIFSLVFFIYNALLLAIWPLSAEAIARNSWGVVTRFAKKYILIGFVMVVFATLLLIWLMPYIVSILSPKEQIIIPVSFIMLLGIYFMIRVWTDTYATLLQSMSCLRPFWLFVPLQAAASLTLQWVLIPKIGIYGVIFGIIGSYLLTVTWALPRVFYKMARN